MRLTIVTSNPGKALEIQQALDIPPEIEVIQKPFELEEIQAMDITTVALHKAQELSKMYHEPFIIEDTGIFFEKCHDFPGAYTKYLFQAIGYEGILRLMQEGDHAYFKTALVYMDSRLSAPQVFEATTRGTITHRVDTQAKAGLPYDNIFIPEGYMVTMSRIPDTEQKHIKHRAKVVRAFSEFFRTYVTTLS